MAGGEVGGGSDLAVRVESRIFWQRVPCQNRYVTCPTPQSLKCLPRKTGSNDMGSGVFGADQLERVGGEFLARGGAGQRDRPHHTLTIPRQLCG